MRNGHNDTCLSCGKQLAAGLRGTGSLRCHDCRDEKAPLRTDLVQEKR